MTRVVRALLIANVAVFFIQMTQPGLVSSFVFYPQLVLVRPWTVVTYMFLHGGFMHILFNMLALFFFGPRVEERLGSRPFTVLYFLSGISGALLSLFFSSAPIIGASGGVFGVMLAFAYFWPDAPILIWGILPVPAAILVVITTALALFGGFTGAQGGVAHFAHLGGFAGAFLYLKWLDRSRRRFKQRAMSGPRVHDPRIQSWKSIDVKNVHEVNREELNRILDKIGKSGLGSLTEQERLFLSNFVPPDDRVPPVS
ncbi:MAG TPA: rhomboid family intramembrane serine protease [Gemmatimonadaceae bacterium]|nr:rhomboid family intramembrane serine protease [Gemmatimonadaceae bacterium]